MDSPWRRTAEAVAEETFLSVREAETVLAYHDLRFPDGCIPPSKEEVYGCIAEELGIEPTTVRTYLTRSRWKMEHGVATAKFVEDPAAYQEDERRAESLSAWLDRQSGLPVDVGPVW